MSMTDQKVEQKAEPEAQPTIPEVVPVVPLAVGRSKSLAALESALSGSRVILLVAQKQDDQEDPGPDDLYWLGTLCKILQVGKQADGTVQVVVEGAQRGAVSEFVQTTPFFQVRVAPRVDPKDKPL